jgi:hypothetical protein
MDQLSSRRLQRRETVEKLEVSIVKWKFRFYCWCWFVFLVPATAQALEVVLALVGHRPPRLLLELRAPP